MFIGCSRLCTMMIGGTFIISTLLRTVKYFLMAVQKKSRRTTSDDPLIVRPLRGMSHRLQVLRVVQNPGPSVLVRQLGFSTSLRHRRAVQEFKRPREARHDACDSRCGLHEHRLLSQPGLLPTGQVQDSKLLGRRQEIQTFRKEMPLFVL